MWATAISTNADNGRKIVFRYAKELSANFDQTRQPTRINIVWKYQSESGQPVSGDHQRMNQLEDLLESVLKEDGFATLALVSTGEACVNGLITQNLKVNSLHTLITRWQDYQVYQSRFT